MAVGLNLGLALLAGPIKKTCLTRDVLESTVGGSVWCCAGSLVVFAPHF